MAGLRKEMCFKFDDKRPCAVRNCRGIRPPSLISLTHLAILCRVPPPRSHISLRQVTDMVVTKELETQSSLICKSSHPRARVRL